MHHKNRSIIIILIAITILTTRISFLIQFIDPLVVHINGLAKICLFVSEWFDEKRYTNVKKKKNPKKNTYNEYDPDTLHYIYDTLTSQSYPSYSCQSSCFFMFIEKKKTSVVTIENVHDALYGLVVCTERTFEYFGDHFLGLCGNFLLRALSTTHSLCLLFYLSVFVCQCVWNRIDGVWMYR